MTYDCLVIDDEKLLADSTAEYFNLFGVKTAVAYSASDCRSFFGKNSARLLLLDINLGDGSGFALCKELRTVTEVPILFISAKTGQRVDRLFELIDYVSNQAATRITTGMLNNVLADAQTRVQPPTDKGRRLKIYYMTQTGIKPPHFVCFCNDARLFHFSYQRYLENQIRSVFGLEGTPIKMTIRQKGDKEE